MTPPPVAGGELTIAGAAVDSQGRIVVVGTSRLAQPPGKELPLHVSVIGQPSEAAHTDVRLLRYLPSGSLDPSFGQGGIVETDLGLPTPEYEGVKLSSAPVVAVDGAGRIVVTGAAAESVITGCFHDDYSQHLLRVVRRPADRLGHPRHQLRHQGGLRRAVRLGKPRGDDAADPVITPDDGVVFQRGDGHCSRHAGGLGFVQLTPQGTALDSSKPGGEHRVFDATMAPDGSVVLLLGPSKAHREAPEAIEKLRPNGSPDPAFGKAGEVVLRLPGESYASRVRVTADGKVLVQGVKVPPYRSGESRQSWLSRFSSMLIGLTANGAPDTRVGPKGIATAHIPGYYEGGGFWLDRRGRPTITAGYRPKGGPTGFAAIRFTAVR
ncbi:MAG TPA: hypothetical protein VFX44_10490 [Solirubrobacterales bacterium]|nr:hypothetical protein [Solirubrobacterales bacterium]